MENEMEIPGIGTPSEIMRYVKIMVVLCLLSALILLAGAAYTITSLL